MKAAVFLISAFVLKTGAVRTRTDPFLEKCEPIAIDMCKGLPYDKTVYPNLLGHKSQEEAGRDIVTYHPLVHIECSPDIKLFLCAFFTPLCTVLDRPLPPCRSLCESARQGCESLMASFNYDWPDSFDCSKLPIAPDLCLGRNSSSPSSQAIERYKTSTQIPGIPDQYDKMMDFICPAQLKAPKDKDYKLRVGEVQVEDCGAPCYNTFFDKDDVVAIKTWAGVFAIICMIPCLFTILTYLIDPPRFPFPQLSIIFMSFCYLMVTIGYVIGFASGDKVACGEAFNSTDINVNNVKTERLIRQGTIDDWRCQVIAMFLYFFDAAGSLWWVMLTVGWFLEAGLKWGSEAIEGSYLHAIVWTVAAIQMVLVVVLKKIEGDILTGVCFVGLWDSHSLLVFVVVPKALCIIISIFFLIWGVVSHIKVRSGLKTQGRMTDTLENHLCRIGLFSLLFLIAAITQLYCYSYEYLHMNAWMASWQEKSCRDPVLGPVWQIPCRQPGKEHQVQDWPGKWLFIMKFVAISLTAALSGTWVWCKKTFETWRQVFTRLTGNANIYDAPHQL